MKKLALLLALILALFSFQAVLAEEPVTLTVLVSRNAAVNAPAAENTAWQYVAEQLNLNLEFTEIDSAAWNEKFNVMMAGGDLPDVITKTNITPVEVKKNMDAGVFVNLADYVEYLPNFMAIVEKDPALKDLVCFDDGSIGGFAQQANYATKETTIMPTSVFMIYQPWLDALNLEMPTTTEELYDVLVHFRDDDPNGNGQKDEIPMSLLYGQSGLKLLANFFALPIDSSVNYCDVDDEGNVYFLANTENYKEFLKYFNRLYTEGLLDNETFTQNQQQVLAKGTSEVPLIGTSAASGAAIVVGSDRAWDMTTTPIIHSENTEPLWTRRVAGYVYTGIITSGCKNIEKACELLDYFYTEEGGRLAWMGIEGQDWDWNEDGTWDFLLKDGEETTTLRARATLQPGGGLAAAFPEAWLMTSNKDEQWFNTFNGQMALSNPEAFVDRYPTVTYDDRTQKELDTIAADITSYVDASMAEFIVGTKDVEAEWDEYCKTLEAMRLKDMLDIMQKGLEG